jgi:hypothetical protein
MFLCSVLVHLLHCKTSIVVWQVIAICSGVSNSEVVNAASVVSFPTPGRDGFGCLEIRIICIRVR